MADVALVPVTPDVRDRVLGLAPRPDQEAFSGRAAQTLPVAEAEPTRHPFAIVERGRPVGLFVLDTTPPAVRPAADLLLRAFFVDAEHQGRGVARAAVAALPPLVREAFPHVREVVLTVNLRNSAARAAYVSGGFVDTGELDLSGSAGPQNVLVLDLRGADTGASG